MQEIITQQAHNAITELLDAAGLSRGQIVVIGCSSSEIVGGVIGKNSSTDAADAVIKGIMPVLNAAGLHLAAQCCEHLNRALIVERNTAEIFGLEIVSVIPQIKAGGSFATAVFEHMLNPVAVEFISAHAGLDIGNTFIGMHLKHVAVPLRLNIKNIGQASVNAAKTRPKLIGGIRAVYPDSVAY